MAWCFKAKIKKEDIQFSQCEKSVDVILHHYCAICINQTYYYEVHLFFKNEAQSIPCPFSVEKDSAFPKTSLISIWLTPVSKYTIGSKCKN